MTDFIRRKEIKRVFGMTPETADALAAEGIIRRYQPKPSIVYFRRSDIDKWIASHEVEPMVTTEMLDSLLPISRPNSPSEQPVDSEPDILVSTEWSAAKTQEDSTMSPSASSVPVTDDDFEAELFKLEALLRPLPGALDSFELEEAEMKALEGISKDKKK